MKKERADKTADPLGMFPLANWISMTDLHFHMGREQEGAESHQEVVTGKLIFERGRSPIDRRRRADRETFAPIDCPDSQSRNSESASVSIYRNKTRVSSSADVTILYRRHRFFSLRRESDVGDRSTRRNSSFELVSSGGGPSEISIRTGCTV